MVAGGVSIRAQIRGLERAWRPLTALRASGRIGEKVPCSYVTDMKSGYVNIFVTDRKFQSLANIFVTATGVSNGPVVGTKRSLSPPTLPVHQQRDSTMIFNCLRKRSKKNFCFILNLSSVTYGARIE